jgi:hypothetical protein
MERKLVAFENKCLRKITNTNWKDYTSNGELREETKQKYITNIIRKRPWAYIGHALRMSEDKIPRQTIMWSPKGKRKRGRDFLGLTERQAPELETAFSGNSCSP